MTEQSPSSTVSRNAVLILSWGIAINLVFYGLWAFVFPGVLQPPFYGGLWLTINFIASLIGAFMIRTVEAPTARKWISHVLTWVGIVELTGLLIIAFVFNRSFLVYDAEWMGYLWVINALGLLLLSFLVAPPADKNK